MKRAVLLVVPLLLAASACGDDDDDAASDTAEAVEGESDDDGGGGGSESEWCELAVEVEELDAVFGDFDPTDPDAMRNAFAEFGDVLDRAADAAPSEIEDDIEQTVDAFNQLRDALEDVDYNFLEIDPADLEFLDNPDVEAASERVEEFNAEECGIEADDEPDATTADDETDTTTADDDSALGEGTIREQMIAGFVASGFTEEEAECLIDNVDLTDPDLASDTAGMLEVFDDCGIDMSRLAELGESLGG
jgi:hypothetical protein